MHFSTVVSVAVFAASAAAILVTEPSKNANVDFSKPTTVKWTSVSTDPKQVSIVLVDANVSPPVQKDIANNVKTSDGSYTIQPLSGVEKGKGYQINIVSREPQNQGILAQSQQFNVVSDAAGDSSSSSTGTSNPTSPASTGTTTPAPTTGFVSTTSSALSGAETTTLTGTRSGSASASTSGSGTSSSTTSTSTGTGGAAGLAVPVSGSIGALLMGLFALGF